MARLGAVQDCSDPSALAKELLQSCTKPSILYWIYHRPNWIKLNVHSVATDVLSSGRGGNIRQCSFFKTVASQMIIWEQGSFRVNCVIVTEIRFAETSGSFIPFLSNICYISRVHIMRLRLKVSAFRKIFSDHFFSKWKSLYLDYNTTDGSSEGSKSQ